MDESSLQIKGLPTVEDEATRAHTDKFVGAYVIDNNGFDTHTHPHTNKALHPHIQNPLFAHTHAPENNNRRADTPVAKQVNYNSQYINQDTVPTNVHANTSIYYNTHTRDRNTKECFTNITLPIESRTKNNADIHIHAHTPPPPPPPPSTCNSNFEEQLASLAVQPTSPSTISYRQRVQDEFGIDAEGLEIRGTFLRFAKKKPVFNKSLSMGAGILEDNMLSSRLPATSEAGNINHFIAENQNEVENRQHFYDDPAVVLVGKEIIRMGGQHGDVCENENKIKKLSDDIRRIYDRVGSVAQESQDQTLSKEFFSEKKELEKRNSIDSSSKYAISITELTQLETFLSIPRSKTGLLSFGSRDHYLGSCKSCVFVCSNQPKTCRNGVRCIFCHHHHEPKKRQRLSKMRRRDAQEYARKLEEIRNKYGRLTHASVYNIIPQDKIVAQTGENAVNPRLTTEDILLLGATKQHLEKCQQTRTDNSMMFNVNMGHMNQPFMMSLASPGIPPSQYVNPNLLTSYGKNQIATSPSLAAVAIGMPGLSDLGLGTPRYPGSPTQVHPSFFSAAGLNGLPPNTQNFSGLQLGMQPISVPQQPQSYTPFMTLPNTLFIQSPTSVMSPLLGSWNTNG